jgi:hypothetical protein
MNKKKFLTTSLFVLAIALTTCQLRPILNMPVSAGSWIYEWDKLEPESVETDARYDQVNWNKALFNQYGTGLIYRVLVQHPHGELVDKDILRRAFQYSENGSNYYLSTGDFVYQGNLTWAAELNALWMSRVNKALFDRQFDGTTKRPLTDPQINIIWERAPSVDPWDFSIYLELESRVSFNINVGAAILGFQTGGSNYETDTPYILDQKNIGMRFFRDDIELQKVLLFHKNLITNPANEPARMYLFDLPTLLTNVNRFHLCFEMRDSPPRSTAHVWYIRFFEFNLFATSDIYIPDIADEDDLYGINYIAAEWWNIPAHFNNFVWWLLNESFIAPFFIFAYKFIIIPIGLFFEWIIGLFSGGG